jgi:poly-gamma-glutamate synthesis protein (capsule biosynthesis protein)
MSFKLCSVGDIMLGENVHHFKRGIIKRYGHNYARLAAGTVIETLSSADLFLFNLESSLMPDEALSSRDIQNGVYIAPVGALSFFDEIKAIKVANVANNHFGQHGKQTFDFSLSALKQKGIEVTGINNQPIIIRIGNHKVKIWGVSLIKDNSYSGGYFKSTYEQLIEALHLNLKEEDEIRIISIHWGEEYLTLENEQQKRLAMDLSEVGFDLILGHHPHVVQPMKKNGPTRVIYSHGNFIFDQDFSKITRTGLIFQFDFAFGKQNLLFSHQRQHRVYKTSPTSPDHLNRYCIKKYHRFKPFFMRILMKLEMIVRFYTLNRSIVGIFGKRFFLYKTEKSVNE